MNRFLNRFGPLSGAASMILGFVGWMAVAGMPPEVATSSTAEVVDFWTDLGDTGRWAGWLVLLGVILMALFGAWLGSAMRDRGATVLATTAGIGAFFIAIGSSIDGSITLTLGDAAASLPAESVVAISAITEYLFIPYAAGLVLLMVSLGASAKQTGLIPSWLAVAGYVLAVVALIPHEVAFIGVMLSMLWLLVTSIVLFRGAGSEVAQA